MIKITKNITGRQQPPATSHQQRASSPASRHRFSVCDADNNPILNNTGI